MPTFIVLSNYRTKIFMIDIFLAMHNAKVGFKYFSEVLRIGFKIHYRNKYSALIISL